MEQWPERLARLRYAIKPRLSQKRVADALGIAASSVAQWETGRSKPDIIRLPALARLYRVSLRELCGDDLPLADVPGPGIEDGEQLPEEIDDQLFLVSRAWPRLSPDERRGMVAAVLAMVRRRPEAA